MKGLLLALIRFYRANISPLRPPWPMLWRPLKNTAPGRGAFLPCAGFSDAIPFTGRRASSMTPFPEPFVFQMYPSAPIPRVTITLEADT